MEHPTRIDPDDVAPGSLLLSAVVGISLAAGGFAIGVGATGLGEGSPWFWYLSRASGLVAYLLLWGSVMWGLLLSTGMGRRMGRGPLLVDVHQFLSTAAVGFAVFHGLVLLGDRYVSFPVLAILVPFAGDHEPWLVALGQVALWLSLFLIASFHLRRLLGGQVWRQLHYASFVVFGFACLHGLALGSESTTVWASLLYMGTLAPVLFLCFYRVLSLKRALRFAPYARVMPAAKGAER